MSLFKSNAAIYILIGLLAGVLSGFFAVGGGTVIVPMLISFLHLDHKKASATSLAAILPIAIVGTISYALYGSIQFSVGIILAIGGFAGAQIGVIVLRKIQTWLLGFIFAGVLFLTALHLFISLPIGDGPVELNALNICYLIMAGLFIGFVAGLLGLGGGVVAVPALQIFFNMAQNLAKGSSLLCIIPTSLSATYTNLKYGLVDLKIAAYIGCFGALGSVLGSYLAQIIPLKIALVLFGINLIYTAYKMAKKSYISIKKI